MDFESASYIVGVLLVLGSVVFILAVIFELV